MKLRYCLLILLTVPAFTNGQSIMERLPAPITDLVYARPFTLVDEHRFVGAQKVESSNSGVIVVLSVDPELIVPRNGPQPVLYAGNRIIETLNWGHLSGHVIALVPDSFDFESEPFWFGTPRTFVELTPALLDSEREAAPSALNPLGKEDIERAFQEPIQAPSMTALLRGEVAELVLQYAPQESDLVRKWRLPEVGGRRSGQSVVVEEEERRPLQE